MAITARRLSQSGARGRDLDVMVREQLGVIDGKLLRHPTIWGVNIVSHELPTALPAAGGLDRRSAQLVVYSAIIQSLERRGFEAALDIVTSTPTSPGKVTLHVRWVTSLASAELRATEELLRGHRLTPATRAGFFAGVGARPLPRHSLGPLAPPPAPAPAPPRRARSDAASDASSVSAASTASAASTDRGRPSAADIADLEKLVR
jgi:hypothetical protein